MALVWGELLLSKKGTEKEERARGTKSRVPGGAVGLGLTNAGVSSGQEGPFWELRRDQRRAGCEAVPVPASLLVLPGALSRTRDGLGCKEP